MDTYQAEGAQNRQSGDALEAQLEQRQGHDDKVEYVPAFFEVELGTVGYQFEYGLDGECRRKELASRKHT